MKQMKGDISLEAEERKPAMTPDEMQEYWKTLCSFTGEDIPSEINHLLSKIHYPRFLFKYRSVNSNNLEALRTNKLFFSQASKYDDPFDTFLHIDIDKVQQEFDGNFSSSASIEALAKGMEATFNNIPGVPQEFLQQVTTPDGLRQLYNGGVLNQFLSSALALRTRIQEEVFSICFSENGFNESLWLKYADMHRGYVLIYDLYDNDSYHCGKLEKCSSCQIVQGGTRIYPVYYSNTPHDATNFAKLVVWRELEQRWGVQIPEFLRGELKPLPWEVERNSLIKKECHKYDEEWRMIANSPLQSPAMIEWVPYGVIVGLRTSQVDTNLIVSLAKEAGIKYAFQSIIDKQNRLSIAEIKI